MLWMREFRETGEVDVGLEIMVVIVNALEVGES